MIKLTDAEIGLCYRFAYKVTERTEKYYKYRNKYASTEKLIHDQFIGKLGELYVFHWLTRNNYLVSYPNFEIGVNKDNGIDLTCINQDKRILNIHIKIVRHDSPVTNSWLAQDNEKSVCNPGDDDFYALCKFYSPDKIELMKLIAAKDITWCDTKIKLPGKKACYLSDM